MGLIWVHSFFILFQHRIFFCHTLLLEILEGGEYNNGEKTCINHTQIGYRIKEVKEQNNFSQARLAEETELSISYISHIENAKRKASLESIIRIVNALGITVDELLAGVQLHNPTAYQTDLDLLMAECTENEKRFIYEMVKASIDSMHKNGWHISDDKA